MLYLYLRFFFFFFLLVLLFFSSIPTLESVWYVCLNNGFQFFWKYVWVQKFVEIHVILFKN